MNLEGASLANANLTSARLEGANPVDANLVGATLKGASLQDANLKDMVLAGVRFADAKPSVVRLGGKVRGRGVIRPDDAVRVRVGGGHDRPVVWGEGD